MKLKRSRLNFWLDHQSKPVFHCKMSLQTKTKSRTSRPNAKDVLVFCILYIILFQVFLVLWWWFLMLAIIGFIRVVYRVVQCK